jgi:hypothetical protein
MSTFNKVLLLGALLLLIGGALFYFAGARRSQIAATETAALSCLNSILREQQANYDVSKRYVPWDQLREGGAPPGRAPGGYRFELRVKPDGQSFEAVATPVEYGKTGRLSFYVNEEGSIRGADKGGAGASAGDPDIFP